MIRVKRSSIFLKTLRLQRPGRFIVDSWSSKFYKHIPLVIVSLDEVSTNCCNLHWLRSQTIIQIYSHKNCLPRFLVSDPVQSVERSGVM